MIKIIISIFSILIVISCRMPSDPIGEINIINRLDTIRTVGDCLDLAFDATDSILIAAANYNGVIAYNVASKNNIIANITELVHIDPQEMNPSVANNRAQSILISDNNNSAFILDKEDHIWLFKYNEDIFSLKSYLSDEDNCFEARSLSLTISDEGSSIGLFTLIKHYSGGSQWVADSRSIVYSEISEEELSLNDNFDVSCKIMLNQGNTADKIFYSNSENLLSLGLGELGFRIFRLAVAEETTCIVTNMITGDQSITAIEDSESYHCVTSLNGVAVDSGGFIPKVIGSFDTNGEVETFFSNNNTIFVGLSYSNGFIQYRVNSDDSISKQEYAKGYSVNSIHKDNDILAIAVGHDGVLLYKSNFDDIQFLGKIETAYANTAKVSGNTIFIGTEDGIEVIQIKL